MLSLSLALMTAVLPTPAITTASALVGTPEAAVRALTSAADRRDVPAMKAALHPDYRVTFAVSGTPGATVLDRATYLALTEGGKIGGTPRTYTAGWQKNDGQFAQIQATLAGAKARFEMVFTVVKGTAGWQVISESTRMVPAAK